MTFGVAAMLAMMGALGAIASSFARARVLWLSASMLGVAGVCLALRARFVALLVALVWSLMVPAAMLAVLRLRAVREPGVTRARFAAAIAVGAAAALGFVAIGIGAPWPLAGGPRALDSASLGYRLLTDHLMSFLLLGVLLASAGAVAVALGARSAAPRAPGGPD
jgi:NADH:ubiquinone oxidoreductase subunit 6 (subunit J)